MRLQIYLDHFLLEEEGTGKGEVQVVTQSTHQLRVDRLCSKKKGKWGIFLASKKGAQRLKKNIKKNTI